MKTQKQILLQIEKMLTARDTLKQKKIKADDLDGASAVADQMIVLLELKLWIVSNES
jgi:hypothetical protein